METLMKCKFCGNNFDTKERIPYLISPCGHQVCKLCIKLLQEGGGLCKRNHTEPVEIIEFTLNTDILEDLQKNFGIIIHCKKHPNKVAEFFKINTQNFICANCAILEENKSNLIQQEQDTLIKQGELLYNYAVRVEKNLQSIKEFGQNIKSKSLSLNGDQAYSQISKAVDLFLQLKINVDPELFRIYINKKVKNDQEEVKTQVSSSDFQQQVYQIRQQLLAFTSQIQANQNNNNQVIKFEKLNNLLASKSLILNSDQRYIQRLISWLNNKYKLGSILYRGTRDGFKASDFHSKCNLNVPTLSLIKTTTQYVFGGFTTQSWKPQNSQNILCVKADPEAFVFSLTKQTKHCIKQKKAKNSIVCNSHLLICFGKGEDIVIRSKCNLAKVSYSNLGNQYAQPNGICSNTTQAQRYLAGEKNFQVAELEVFQLK